MIQENFSSMIAPPAGGLKKLRENLARESQAEQEEKFVMNIVVLFLLVGVSFFGLKDFDFGPPKFRDSGLVAKKDLQPPGVIADSETEVTRLGGTPPNVQIYLLSKQ